MTQVVTVSVQVSKETHELCQGFVKFVSAVKKALDDGWQPFQDTPVLITAALRDLVPAMDGVVLVSDELKATPDAFYAALGVSMKDLAKVFLNP